MKYKGTQIDERGVADKSYVDAAISDKADLSDLGAALDRIDALEARIAALEEIING